jgi:hypothetical protein
VTVTKALIIDDPWIDYILDGSKTWEMRSTGASHRGWFGLIRKRTGAVWGVARLVASGSPLSPEEMIATFDKHRIPAELILSGKVAKWNTPWELADVRNLASPVPYRHKPGAVTWVELDERATVEITRQLESTVRATRGEPARQPAQPIVKAMTAPAPAARAAKPAPAPSRAGALGRMICEIEITQGNLDHNHFYLRQHLHRFPDDLIGGANKAKMARREALIDWGGPEPASSDIDGVRHKFFRRRSWVGAFYRMNRVRAGDRIRIEESAPYHYRVKLVR